VLSAGEVWGERHIELQLDVPARLEDSRDLRQGPLDYGPAVDVLKDRIRVDAVN
jgi:hypothetical protein